MSDSAADRDRLRQLRRAARAGVIPADLLPLVVELAEMAASDEADVACEAGPSPAEEERLLEAVADQVGHWMAVRGATPRSLTISPRTIRRLLRAEDALLSTIAAAAAELGCRVTLRFEDLGAGARGPAAPSDEKIDPGGSP